MKIIVTFGPVIGGVILAAYVVVLRIYAYVKEKDTVAEKYKRIYKLMIIADNLKFKIITCKIPI